MKTLKQIREEYNNQVLDQINQVPDEIMLEGRETAAMKPSPKNVPGPSEMPSMLLFRRVAYRAYPGRQVVALYYSKLVNKYLSVPFGPDGNLNLSEAEVLDEGVIGDTLKGAAKGALVGHVAGTAAGLAPGAIAGTVAGAAIGGYKAAKKSMKKAEVKEDWQDVNRKDKTDGLSQKAVNAYRRENPGSKLQTAVTEKNPSGKRAARRKSFCSRMGGMKKRLTSAKTARDPDSRINKALRRWNCEESFKAKLEEKRYNVNEGWRDTLISVGKSMPGYQDKEASKEAWKKGDYKGAIKSQAKALGKAALTGAGVALGARALPTLARTAVAAATTSAAKDDKKETQSKPDNTFTPVKASSYHKQATKAKSTWQSAKPSDATFQSKQKAALSKEISSTKSMAENKISDIRQMVNEGNKRLDMEINGRSVHINTSMAKRILEVYDSVNTKNKKIVESMLNDDLESFKKLLNFSIKV